MDLRKIKKLIEMLQESDLNEIEVKKVKRVSELTEEGKCHTCIYSYFCWTKFKPIISAFTTNR